MFNRRRAAEQAHLPTGAASARLRRSMVHDQLRSRGIADPRVLAAMSEVPREEFVSPDQQRAAYDDCPLPIGHGQTISQPFTVACMLEAAQLQGRETVLEVGTGSGYGAAVLARLATTVYTVERIPELGERAAAQIERLGYDNVHVRVGDGTLGCPEHAPFDAIVVTAGGSILPPEYERQLADGGRIVIPLGEAPTRQRMKRFTRRGGELAVEDLGGFVFVPLIGRDGWSTASEAPNY